MADESIDRGDERPGVNRRTVMKGAAWSVPVVMVAAAAPAAASLSSDIDIDFGQSTGCKLPGNSWGADSLCYRNGYVLWGAFVNRSGVDLYVKVNWMNVGGIAQCVVGMTDPSIPCPYEGTGSNTILNPPTATNCMLIPSTATDGNPKYIGVFSDGSSDASSTTVQVNLSWYSNSACSTLVSGSTFTSDGEVGGDSWTTPAGGGSCTFPPGTVCKTPPTACGVTGANCAA